MKKYFYRGTNKEVKQNGIAVFKVKNLENSEEPAKMAIETKPSILPLLEEWGFVESKEIKEDAKKKTSEDALKKELASYLQEVSKLLNKFVETLNF